MHTLQSPQTDKPGGYFLVVDDQEDIGYILQMIIEGTGNCVDCFTNPLDALNAFRDHPEKYKGIFTDLRMPFLTGEELIGEIRLVNASVPIAVVTANTDRMTQAEQAACHITFFIEKPFGGEEIEQVVYSMQKC